MPAEDQRPGRPVSLPNGRSRAAARTWPIGPCGGVTSLNLGSRKILAASLAVASLNACHAPEDGRIHPGSVVKPGDVGTARFISTGKPVNIALYEYANLLKFTTTGRSISFEIPEEYFSSAGDRRTGPQYAISLTYNGQTLAPIESLFRQLPAKTSSAVEEPVSLTLAVRGWSTSLSTATLLAKGGHYPALQLETALPLVKKAGKYCGMTIFQGSRVWTDGARDVGSRNPHWAFSQSVVFAEPSSPSEVRNVIYCNSSVLTDGYPLCSAADEYHGWPRQLYFSAKHVCDLSAIRNGASTLLDRYVKYETPRSPGYVPDRGEFIPIK
jgi:hypothetical protein